MNALDDMRRMYRDYATALEAELARLRKIETAARGLTVHYHVEETPLESTVTLRKHLWDALRTALNAHLASEEGECGFTKAYADALKALAEGSDRDEQHRRNTRRNHNKEMSMETHELTNALHACAAYLAHHNNNDDNPKPHWVQSAMVAAEKCAETLAKELKERATSSQ